MTNRRPWRLIRQDNIVRIRAGRRGGALYWLPITELREFADTLHDLADAIDREKRGDG